MPVYEATTAPATTSRSATPTGTPARLRRDDPSRHRHSTSSSRRRRAAATCSSSGGSTPTRARVEAIEVADAARSAAGDRRDRPGPELLRRAGRAARRRRARAIRRPGRPATAPRLLGGAHALLHLDRLRRAVRLQRRRGDGLRDAGDRHRRGSMPEIVRDGETGFLVDDRRRGGRGGRASAALDRQRGSRAPSSTGSPSGGWSTTISTSIGACRTRPGESTRLIRQVQGRRPRPARAGRATRASARSCVPVSTRQPPHRDDILERLLGEVHGNPATSAPRRRS